MLSETRIEKAGFRLETKKRQSYAVEKTLFSMKKKNDYDFQLGQTVEKTEIFDPTGPSDSCNRKC